jgi:archaellum component FlaF (FlaF/FlaG flagellin family)
MRTWVRFLFIAALVAGFVVAVAPASANHESNPVAVFCDPTTGELTITITVFGSGVGNSTEQAILLEGEYITFLDFGYGIGPGTYTQSIIVPKAAYLGANVMVTDGDVSVRTKCGVTDAAPIPAGFVLHSISCNTPVYDEPAGQPVGANAVTAGQTWYVNPTPVTGGDGGSWSEIFVAGWNNGFIPTSCVG